MFIKEIIETKIAKEYDVAVCGGGFAGISAALAAAREGKRTVLFEKQYMLGGLGTAGLVTIYLPLCDGFGHQVSFGIAEELLKLSISMGAEGRYPENWLDGVGECNETTKRFEVQYNPQLFAILAERELLSAGVDILYGTYVVGVDVKDSKINHLITENKSGRLAYKVSSVVDATGDCDIAWLAGVPTKTFNQGNVLAAWYYYVGKEGYKLNALGPCDIPDEEKTTRNAPRPLIDRRFSGLDGCELSEQVCLSHNSTYNDIVKRRAEDPTLMPTTIATIPQIKKTRKIVGQYELSDKEMHTRFDDSIGMISNWKKRGPIYEVPFSTLYCASIKNLACAGRCTSVNETLWDVMRVIPCCAVTGEAAGVAAAMSSDFTTIDVSLLQKKLRERGVKIHIDEIM